MDIYTKESRWKLYLALAGVVIVLISMVYSNYIATRIAEQERKSANTIILAYEEMQRKYDPTCQSCIDFTFHRTILGTNTTIPTALVSETGAIDFFMNFPEGTDSMDVAGVVQKLDQQGFQPIKVESQQIYFQQSRLLTLLQYFPFVQLMLIIAFVLFGYLAFSSARRAEENRVWVGMAKETAHQLGTPISGILGWIQHIEMIREGDEEMQEIVTELGKDVKRLSLVADRFSKIGSAPELTMVNAFTELDACRAYMERRAPRKVNFEFPAANAGHLGININQHLFDWVVENLLRNALDAMGGKGTISADIYDDNQYVYIDISDTGKGIPANKFSTVFRPGFTTKKRGWGLGLSLAKRIIEEYHSGKIFVKKSEEGVGTTFTIQMPKASSH